MKKVLLLSILLVLGASQIFGQAVSINTDGSLPNASSILDVKSTTKGVLVPRMTSAERNAIAAPATGLLVYDLTTQSYFYFNGTTWFNFQGFTGAGTTNFIPKWTPNGNTLGNSILFDDGNSVGVGTNAPGYKFDVLHSGSTGIRSQSSGSFSVVDIDGANGDAALRFAKAGVNQWNTRNRPGDDYYEIFELGGGGSRFVIQDATGNVGIGETVNPVYKLDVLHGGSTGIRSRSDASFSVVDIDGASGDAALRFQNKHASRLRVLCYASWLL